MGFRNIVLPSGKSANSLEADSTAQIPKASSLSSLEFGAGDKTFKGDERGIWMGSSTPDDAPFYIDMLGNISIRASSLTSDTAIRYYDSDGNLSILIGFGDE